MNFNFVLPPTVTLVKSPRWCLSFPAMKAEASLQKWVSAPAVLSALHPEKTMTRVLQTGRPSKGGACIERKEECRKGNTHTRACGEGTENVSGFGQRSKSHPKAGTEHA